MRYSIYTLASPIDNTIFYVGKTVDLKTRFKAHLNLQHADSAFKNQIIEFILNNGSMPVIEELDFVECVYRQDEDYVNELEIYWIHQLYAWGMPLCNIAGLKKKQIYKRRYEHILKESFGEKLIAFVKEKKTKILNFISEVMEADNLTVKEKAFLINGSAYYFNNLIEAINKKNDIECYFIVDNYEVLIRENVSVSIIRHYTKPHDKENIS